MTRTARITEGPLEPIFTSVKEAARALDITPWAVYQLLDKQAIESRYHGRRRLVVISSLRSYAENLPTVPAGRNVTETADPHGETPTADVAALGHTPDRPGRGPSPVAPAGSPDTGAIAEPG